MSDCSDRRRNFDWWLKSSGRFSTSFSKSYLERTQLPEDLLRVCVDHLTCKLLHNKNKDAANKAEDGMETRWAVITHDQLNTICQNAGYRSRSDLLAEIRRECKSLRTNGRPAQKLVDWLGPVHWRAVLEPSNRNDGVAICSHCGMLIIKFGGCNNMRCSCGHNFDWSLIKLNSKGVALVCRAFGQDRRDNKSNNSGRHNDLRFCRRVLEIADKIVGFAIDFSKRKQKPGVGRRPLLHVEDLFDISDDIRSQRLSNDSDWFDDGDEDENSRYLAIVSEGLSSESLAQEAKKISDMYPPTDDSFCDYSVVSNPENCSTSSEENQWEESSSFSLLSGCDTIHSLDNSSCTGEEIAKMSYCKAVKIGISVNKRAQKLHTDGPTTVLATNSPHCQTGSLVNSSSKEVSQKKLIEPSMRRTEYHRSDVGNEEEDDDQSILSIYDAAKSCRGGRPSTQFHGNSRQSQRSSWGGWRNQRRPNWSRKRRKEYKNHWQHTTNSVQVTRKK